MHWQPLFKTWLWDGWFIKNLVNLIKSKRNITFNLIGNWWATTGLCGYRATTMRALPPRWLLKRRFGLSKNWQGIRWEWTSLFKKCSNGKTCKKLKIYLKKIRLYSVNCLNYKEKLKRYKINSFRWMRLSNGTINILPWMK